MNAMNKKNLGEKKRKEKRTACLAGAEASDGVVHDAQQIQIARLMPGRSQSYFFL